MACHEQGVELDGFQEERIEEDDFADGSAEERRERRASPSGDREATKSTNVLVMVNITKIKKNETQWLRFSISAGD